MPSTLVLSDSLAQMRDAHGDASKKYRIASEALHEADMAAQGARGLCYEWISHKVGTDAEFMKLREDAATKSALYSKLLDEQRAAQTLEMRHLHNELTYLTGTVNAIQAKLGISNTLFKLQLRPTMPSGLSAYQAALSCRLPSVRTILMVDAAANLLGTIPFICFPYRALCFLALEDAITPLSLTMTQWFGMTAAALSVPMYLAATNKERDRERIVVFWTLLAVELGTIGLLAWQWVKGGTGLKKGTEEGFMACFTPMMLWRVWVLTRQNAKEAKDD
ncbi:MAG: hypothetical protein Q9225_000821 [Loekoesia sp. 1 TL-2023]